MNFNEYKALRQKIRGTAFYIIVAFVSILSMVFIPLLDSDVKGDFVWPTTTAGWILWLISTGGVAIVNMCIFYCFMEQAKVNSKDNEKYKEACEILNRLKANKDILPKSPEKWTTMQYSFKGAALLVISAFSTFAFTRAILKFDLTAFLSTLFTLLSGVVFGYLQMRKAEEYWTEEFWQYAKLKENEYKNSSQSEKFENEPKKGQEIDFKIKEEVADGTNL